MRLPKMLVRAMTLIAAGLLLVATHSSAHAGPDAADYSKCAAACRDCARACDACNKHCIAMAKAGGKQHLLSAQLSADCLEICNSAAKIVARKGPMAKAICEACIKACDACGAECGKSMAMAPMAACSKSCKDCSAACKKMIGG